MMDNVESVKSTVRYVDVEHALPSEWCVPPVYPLGHDQISRPNHHQ